ncbi:hypothetical protein CCZ01_02625 [Helicobacter monodelphidis]|uniref:hypothetical protein n=1 Tax=Helicobacter sp. 15-1451 TaxID=2004995 RepID=UPI000DCEB03F|nr:hypothetical protein [Helicobacter sp. 15-1451]RAX58330.1 hypothetical protein CCZ01_02625 [Helicobacter sp. 15-1451]
MVNNINTAASQVKQNIVHDSEQKRYNPQGAMLERESNVNLVENLTLESSGSESYEIEKKRNTFGLTILEVMSDSEYAAFERITAAMTPGEKMLAAQSLYRLTIPEGEVNPYPQEQKNAYGNTLKFGEKFAKAIWWGDTSMDKRI